MSRTALGVDRAGVCAAVLLTAVLFTSRAADPVNVVKLTALVLCAVVLLASLAVQAVRTRVLQVPWGAPGLVVLGLATALVVSAVSAPVTSLAVLGAYGRNSGLLAYLSGLVVLVVAMRVLERPATRYLVGAVVAAGLFTATYGLLQRAGYDSVPWNNPFNPVIAALGNPNFAAGYLGVSAAVGAGGALYAGWAREWRALCAVTAVLCLVAAALSSSVQGPIAAAGGLLVVAVAVALERPAAQRRAGLGVLAAGTGLGVVVLLVGAVAQAGPAAAIFTDTGSRARSFYWSAALTMLGDRPLLGVGLDHYGSFWRSARSAESVQALGGPSYSDAAHSVPLQMLAQGGLLLGLAYLALVLLVLVSLVRGLRRLRGPDRLLLAAVGGGWAAYQVQAAVSIDQVPLLTLHLALAGAVLAASGTVRWREVRLPGAVHADAPGTAGADLPRGRRVADAAVLAGVGLLAVLAAVQATVPLRASASVLQGDTALSTGDGDATLAAYDRAVELVPGQSAYWLRKGALYDRLTPPATQEARAAYDRAVLANPYDVGAVAAAARTAAAEGDVQAARALYRRSVELDGLNPATVEAAARYEGVHGDTRAAGALVERSLVRLPGSAPLWSVLGDVRAVLGDPTGARAAYDRALALDPTQAGAAEGLARLPR